MAQPHIPHKNRKLAYHVEYAIRTEAFVWRDGVPVEPNFYPYGTEIRKWMLRQYNDLPVLSPATSQFTNPYSYSASVLAFAYQFIINDGANFAKGSDVLHPSIAEISRLRLLGENVLYTARLCEALIKQLLYCTTALESEYRTAALGALLSKNCNGCSNSNKKRHNVSLMGSLAHRYQLCAKYEHCVETHLVIVNKQRNLEAAHSGTPDFHPQDASVVRERFQTQLNEIGEPFIHMLQHIGEIETQMMFELNGIINQHEMAASDKRRTARQLRKEPENAAP
jgi:hypothetical protein